MRYGYNLLFRETDTGNLNGKVETIIIWNIKVNIFCFGILSEYMFDIERL